VPSTPELAGWIARATEPSNPLLGSLAPRWLLRRRQVCPRHLKSEHLADLAQDEAGPPVNRLLEGWPYYVARVPPDSDEDARHVKLRLFLDSDHHYPAVLGLAAEENGADLTIRGSLEIVHSTSCSWALSFALVVSLVGFVGVLFVLLILSGVGDFTDHFKDYQKGIPDTMDGLFSHLSKILSKNALADLEKKAADFAKSALPDIVASLALSVEDILWQTFLFVLYLCFWLFEPLPVSCDVARLIRSYLLLKTIVCLMFAGLLAAVLSALQCSLWRLMLVLTFLLNYIPEIGAVMSAGLAVAAVIFDGSVPRETRLLNTLWLAILGTAIKVVTGNIIEVRLYATRGGQFLRMHPVFMMLLLMLCSQLLGASGMFMAIPIMAVVKYYMLAADVPPALLNPMLVVIEGDTMGAHKNFVDRHRSLQAGRDAGREADLGMQAPLVERTAAREAAEAAGTE